MGFSIDAAVPALTVFLQGILSFFSPCVLPLIPLYMGYLSGGAKTTDESGAVHYRRSTVLLNTFFFVLGVSFAFFLLGLGFSAIGQFFSRWQSLFSRIGGAVVVLFGLYQLGVFGSGLLGQERRLPLRLDRLAMNPLTALLLGFTFSFAWTPCIGPVLTSVLLMASSAASSLSGFLLIGVYTLGFVLPFLALGLFTGSLLSLFRRRQNIVRYTVKAGGVLLIIMGVMMFTGWMNGVTGYLSQLSGTPAAPEEGQTSSSAAASSSQPSSSAADAVPAPDFTLTDQNGVEHTLSDYRGQVVFLNFWATWCGPCQSEMPDIQALYEAYGSNGEDLVVLGVANPKNADHPQNADQEADGIARFLKDGGYTYPVAMDPTGDVFAAYGISAFPTTFMIDRDGNVFGYVSGALTSSIMKDIVRQTMEGVRS
ncbi:MAG: cytochrome c biogenesis protein CcdA [Oscillospiraceae bacterium]|nr:cytochrome c biogenesis protein CcdA [Oscillospiraceae bacterium]